LKQLQISSLAYFTHTAASQIQYTDSAGTSSIILSIRLEYPAVTSLVNSERSISFFNRSETKSTKYKQISHKSTSDNIV